MPRTPSLREFLDTNPTPSSIPNWRALAVVILPALSLVGGTEAARIADKYDEQARMLEAGEAYELSVGTGAELLVYDVVEPTVQNAMAARWISDAIREPALGMRLLALMPQDELRDLRERIASSQPSRRPRQP